MRHWVLILLAILFGLGLGLGGTVLELGASPSGTIQRDYIIASGGGGADLSGPHVSIDETNFDFGSMERGLSRTQAFKIRNTGGRPLTIQRGNVSCGQCITNVHISHEEVAPGESTDVVLTFRTTTMGPFRHSADVYTNDSSRPQVQFTITGKVMNSFRLSPEEVVFSGASSTSPTTAELRVYSYRGAELEVTGHEFLDASTAELFEVRIEPLSDEQLKEDPDAKSGAAVLVSAKPGLPVGPIFQRLQLTLGLPGSPVVEVPIRGNVVSDVQVIGEGRGWNSETGILGLGTISRREGATIELTLQARGDKAKELQPKLKSTMPDFIQVEFGQRTEIPGGRFVRVPLIIKIPQGTRPAVHLGNKQGEMGEIVIDTGHPDAKELKLLVRFAVGD